MDKVPTQIGEASSKSEIAIELKEKVLTDENKKKAKKGLKQQKIWSFVFFWLQLCVSKDFDKDKKSFVKAFW